MFIADIQPDAVAVSGDLTQRCTHAEFAQARAYLDMIQTTAPYIVVPGNHDIRWLGAVVRNLDITGLLQRRARDFKYSRYARHISQDLTPSLEVPGAVIAGLNTAHGITRGSLTTRLKDLGVIGHVRHRDIERVKQIFSRAAPDAARIVMIHHNPVRGELSRRHGLANTRQALQAFTGLGAELILCGHDHQEAIHTVEETEPGPVISTAGTISNRLRPGRASSFNLVGIGEQDFRITTYLWKESDGFFPSSEKSFRRRVVTEA